MSHLIYPFLPGETRAENEARAKLERDAETARNRRAAQQRRSDACRDAVRYIYADLPTCDDCGSTDLKTTRTLESSPDGITRIVNCRSCGSHFHLILLAKEI